MSKHEKPSECRHCGCTLTHKHVSGKRVCAGCGKDKAKR